MLYLFIIKNIFSIIFTYIDSGWGVTWLKMHSANAVKGILLSIAMLFTFPFKKLCITYTEFMSIPFERRTMLLIIEVLNRISHDIIDINADSREELWTLFAFSETFSIFIFDSCTPPSNIVCVFHSMSTLSYRKG